MALYQITFIRPNKQLWVTEATSYDHDAKIAYYEGKGFTTLYDVDTTASVVEPDVTHGTYDPTVNTSGPTVGSAPSVALVAVNGLVTPGAHKYKVSWSDYKGETLATGASDELTTVAIGHGKVNVTVPALPNGAVSANIYRNTVADSATYKLVASGVAPGVYLDNKADASLGAAEPTANTSGRGVILPGQIGDIYINTSTGSTYIAKGVATLADWVEYSTGANGTSGTSGLSGSSGTSGLSGTSGSSGTSGHA